MRIVQGSTSTRARGQDAAHFQVSHLYWLEFSELDTRGLELNLVALDFWVEDEVSLGRPRGRADGEDGAAVVSV